MPWNAAMRAGFLAEGGAGFFDGGRSTGSEVEEELEEVLLEPEEEEPEEDEEEELEEEVLEEATATCRHGSVSRGTEGKRKYWKKLHVFLLIMKVS
jgi:hypothetical protein